ncbi:MAG TPA: potassium channel family protein [Clostridia bacterium]|nr:potassium channel family protein [Clostridia bacterium]
MINLHIKVFSKDKATREDSIYKCAPIRIDSESLVIDSEKLSSFTEGEMSKEDIYGFEADISTMQMCILTIKDIDTFSLSKDLNMEATFSYINIENIWKEGKIDKLVVDNLCCIDANIDIRTSNVNTLISTCKEMNDTKADKNDLPIVDSLVIHDSKIKDMYILVPYVNIALYGTRVERLSLGTYAECENLGIVDNSIINRLTMMSNLKVLCILASTVDVLEFQHNTIYLLMFVDYIIHRVYGCKKNSIEKKCADSWKLIMDSSRAEDNPDLYAYAGYNYMLCKRKNMKKSMKRIGYWILEKTCGYGFKPSYTLSWSFLVWMISAFIYLFSGGIKSNIDETNMTAFNAFFNALYYSTITFTTTGYGDFIPIGVIAKTCAGLETVSGTSLIALLIFSLTKRYGSFR